MYSYFIFKQKHGVTIEKEIVLFKQVCRQDVGLLSFCFVSGIELRPSCVDDRRWHGELLFVRLQSFGDHHLSHKSVSKYLKFVINCNTHRCCCSFSSIKSMCVTFANIFLEIIFNYRITKRDRG
jgi:hypothetical protein